MEVSVAVDLDDAHRGCLRSPALVRMTDVRWMPRTYSSGEYGPTKSLD